LDGVPEFLGSILDLNNANIKNWPCFGIFPAGGFKQFFLFNYLLAI
jgi:hypothetical protein